MCLYFFFHHLATSLLVLPGFVHRRLRCRRRLSDEFHMCENFVTVATHFCPFSSLLFLSSTVRGKALGDVVLRREGG